MPAEGVGMAVAAAVAVDMWSRAVGMGGVAFKTKARVGGVAARGWLNNLDYCTCTELAGPCRRQHIQPVLSL